MQTAESKIQFFGLIRDASGNPKFDDINNIPGPIWGMLTDAEKQHILTQRETAKTQE